MIIERLDNPKLLQIEVPLSFCPAFSTKKADQLGATYFLLSAACIIHDFVSTLIEHSQFIEPVTNL